MEKKERWRKEAQEKAGAVLGVGRDFRLSTFTFWAIRVKNVFLLPLFTFPVPIPITVMSTFECKGD